MTTDVTCVDRLCNACSCDLLGYVVKVNMLRITFLYRSLSSRLSVVVLVMFVMTGLFVGTCGADCWSLPSFYFWFELIS